MRKSVHVPPTIHLALTLTLTLTRFLHPHPQYVSCSPFRVPLARLAAAHAVIEEDEARLEACAL